MWKLIFILALFLECSTHASVFELLQPIAEASLTCGPITFIDSYTESLDCSLKDVKSSNIEVAVTSSDVDMAGFISRENFVNIDITGDDKYPEYFPKHLAKTLKGTTTFTYTKTPLKVIKRDDLTDFGTKLYILSLADNKIEDIAYDALHGLTKLRNLILSNNKLKSLPSNLLSNAPIFDSLFINSNELTELHPDLFKDSPLFNFLSAEFNKIDKIDKDLFKNNINLSIVLMKYNKIRNIPINFTRFELLDSVDFTHNGGSCDTMFFSFEPYEEQYDAIEKKKWIKRLPEFQKKIEDVCRG
ncbi:hypothetical protein ACKWTF_014285 [Chironomus riparius]